MEGVEKERDMEEEGVVASAEVQSQMKEVVVEGHVKHELTLT